MQQPLTNREDDGDAAEAVKHFADILRGRDWVLRDIDYSYEYLEENPDVDPAVFDRLIHEYELAKIKERLQAMSLNVPKEFLKGVYK